MAHEIMPTATTIAFLVNPTSPLSQTMMADAFAAGRALGVQVHAVHASTEDDFDTVFWTLAELRTRALVIGECKGCAGTGKRACAVCGGTGTVQPPPQSN
jgi:hypothetical protein